MSISRGGVESSTNLSTYEYLNSIDRKLFNADQYAGSITIPDGERPQHPLYQALRINTGESYGYALVRYNSKYYLVYEGTWDASSRGTIQYTLHPISERTRTALLQFRPGTATIVLDKNHEKQIQLIR